MGDQLKVVLHSNASTGYAWKAEGMEEEAVLKQEGDPKIIAPKSKLTGAAGKTQFTFVAQEQGTEELGFWYMPPATVASRARRTRSSSRSAPATFRST